MEQYFLAISMHQSHQFSFHCHVFVQNIGHAALEALNDFQANVLAKELQAWCVFVARR